MASARQLWADSSLMKKKDETEELLVFGYSCKLFRDDEKALYIDQGKHLIPWMGDDTLKIDRYDVRGTVYDLRPLEPLGGGASDALWTSLSDAERRVEQLCDEERYRALYHNEAEEALYQEEELKRLHKALDPQNSYGQVAYSYDNETGQDASDVSASKEANEADEEEDEPFIPPQELDIPVGMVLPERTKLNAIIEKTAAFINTQGPQMEIILKMKQANNPQFSFLSFDCPLHAYYRHLLMAIKTGRYRTKQQRQQQEINDAENAEHYLHPSLASAATRVELAPSIPSISYKPSADCAYSMLVNKIKDRHGKQIVDENNGSASSGDGTKLKDNSTEQSKSPIVFPPPDVQVIIDKMASYVIKNGRDFESVVRNKGDERFAFLDIDHEFHPYYEHKVRVYQGLEAPQNFSQSSATSTNSSISQKCSQPSLKKKQSPIKNQRPILLPGYEFSDQSSESDEDEIDARGESSGKTKLVAPVSFSIKKPKEAEILKEVKSALPIEEESSEGEANEDSVNASKSSNPILESKSTDQELPYSDPPLSENPEKEMQRLQKLLREKEKQLREQERQRKLSEKRNQDIFQIESKEKLVSPSTHVNLPIAVQEKSHHDPNSQITESIPEESEAPRKCDDDTVIVQNDISTDTNVDEESSKVVNVNADELIKDITETEIIDLTEETDEAPKVTDTMRLERKRKAAAFLSLIRKEHPLIKNGGSRAASDSDAASRHSSPSPPRSKRDKTDHGVAAFHEAGIPRTSLMARLAASTHLPRKPHTDKIKITKEKSRSQRKLESPVKSAKEREGKSRQVKLKSKKKEEPPEYLEHERSRSRSRSLSYSRSPPHKRRQGDDSDSEQRIVRYRRETKNERRTKYENTDGPESSRDHTHHHRRYEEGRHNNSHSHGHTLGRGQGRSHSHSHGHGHLHSHSHMKNVEVQESDSDSSD